MAGHERESLFSLEVVVDEVSIPGITCRYPAVAVRLMDFPTLMIHHADDRVKRLIQINLLHKATLPRQLPEILDANDNFAFKKGKSCLFKFNAKALRTHLSNTPMYVLVVDTHPEVPKLIASCAIPLTQSMNRLYEHITTAGVAIPQTDGMRAIYPIRNLMGVDVGHIVFGYRMLSLGEGLLQHIPAESLVTRESEDVVKVNEDGVIGDINKRKADVEPILATDEPVQSKKQRRSKLRKSKPEVLEISTIQHIFNESIMNREFFAAATQTDAPRRDVAVGETVEEDVNLYRPPPLYFSSAAEEKPVVPVVKTPLTRDFIPNVGFDFEDIDSLQEFEREVSKPAPVVIESAPHVNQLPRPGMQYADMQQSLSQFPVLRALFDELNRIQRTGGFQLPGSDASARPATAKTNPKVEVKNAQGKENREHFLQRISTPKSVPHWERPSLPKANDNAVPKHRSWLRKEPLVGQKKTKLSYGMTNTQRLRLAMNNPHKLRELESDNPTKSPIAQKLLENLAGFGQTRVLNTEPSDGPSDEVRPIPTPRRHPPVRHSNEFVKINTEPNVQKSADHGEVTVPSRSVHIPVASYNESEIIEALPPKFPGFKPTSNDFSSDDENSFPVRDSGAGMRIAVINPKASKSSPIASLRNSQAFASARSDERVGETVGPTAKPRLSIELQHRPVLKTTKSVSFDASEGETNRPSSEFSDEAYDHHNPRSTDPTTRGASLATRDATALPDSVHTDSVSSYAPSDQDPASHEYSRDSEYSDDFEVDIPMSPTHRPSLPKIYSMAQLGYTY